MFGGGLGLPLVDQTDVIDPQSRPVVASGGEGVIATDFRGGDGSRPAHAEIVVRNAIRIGWEVATEVEVDQWVHASEQGAAEVPIAILAGEVLPDQTVAVGEFTVIEQAVVVAVAVGLATIQDAIAVAVRSAANQIGVVWDQVLIAVIEFTSVKNAVLVQIRERAESVAGNGHAVSAAGGEPSESTSLHATTFEILNLKVLGDPGLKFNRDLIRAGPFAVKKHFSIQDQSDIVVMLKEQGVRS